MGLDQELGSLTAVCQRRLQEDSPGAMYLLRRGYSFDVLKSLGLGYYQGPVALPILSRNLRGFLWKWGEENKAVLYPLRTLGGTLTGVQLGALREKRYEDFFIPGAGRRGTFFYPDSFDWKEFHRRGQVVLVEGCLDACALSLHLKCVLACLSARVTQGQQFGLRRWGREIYCTFDSDEAGEAGYDKFQHFWEMENILLQRAPPLLKDPQGMFEEDPGRLRNWVRSWAPRALLRSES